MRLHDGPSKDQQVADFRLRFRNVFIGKRRNVFNVKKEKRRKTWSLLGCVTSAPIMSSEKPWDRISMRLNNYLNAAELGRAGQSIGMTGKFALLDGHSPTKMYSRSTPVFSSARANIFVHGLLSSFNAFSRYSFTAAIRAIFLLFFPRKLNCPSAKSCA